MVCVCIYTHVLKQVGEWRISVLEIMTNYKKKFVKEKGKSNYSIMLEPPDVKHAMDVAKKQSNVSSSSHSLGPTCTRGSHTGARWAGPSEWSP